MTDHEDRPFPAHLREYYSAQARTLRSRRRRMIRRRKRPDRSTQEEQVLRDDLAWCEAAITVLSLESWEDAARIPLLASGSTRRPRSWRQQEA